MWESKSKYDLIIEVWEKLDCENVGRTELEAIETVVQANYGVSPLDTPMRLARLLADEGAELRHSEILDFDIERRTESLDLPLLSSPLDVVDLVSAIKSIRELEGLRVRFVSAENNESLKSIRTKAKAARDECLANSSNQNKSAKARIESTEIAELLSIWIQSPEIYDSWMRAKYPQGTSNDSEEK